MSRKNKDKKNFDKAGKIGINALAAVFTTEDDDCAEQVLRIVAGKLQREIFARVKELSDFCDMLAKEPAFHFCALLGELPIEQRTSHLVENKLKSTLSEIEKFIDFGRKLEKARLNELEQLEG